MQISAALQGIVQELTDFKFLKMGQNLHTNMEGFLKSQSHYYFTLLANYLN